MSDSATTKDESHASRAHFAREYRAVYFDLDGTLLDRRSEVPGATLTALSRLRRAGVKVGIATGRMFRSAAAYASQVEADAPLIVYNGARVMHIDGGRVIFEMLLEREIARIGLEAARSHRIHVNLYVGDDLYVESLDRYGEGFMTKEKLRPRQVEDLEAAMTADPVKMLLIGDPPLLRKCQAAITERAGPRATLVFSEVDYLEMLPGGVSKGLALRHSCEQLGIDTSQVVAFGDGENDADMLRTAGWGVAMGNARPEAKAAAHHVTGCHSGDGVVSALRIAFPHVDLDG
jgi:hypothetical protein